METNKYIEILISNSNTWNHLTVAKMISDTLKNINDKTICLHILFNIYIYIYINGISRRMNTNTLGKGMNPIILPQAMGK